VTIKFMSVDAAQFCLCKNPINCPLSMNKERPPKQVLYSHDKLDFPTFV